MSTAAEILWLLSALFAIGGAVGTIMAHSPLRSAVALLIHISALAALFLTMHAQLLAVLQLLIYAGAVVVLFIFVIMLIGPQATIAPGTRGLLSRTAALGIMAVLACAIAFSVIGYDRPYPSIPPGFGQVTAFGQALYRDTLLPFEMVSITLLVAIVGAVAVARGRTAEEREQALRERGVHSQVSTRHPGHERRLAGDIPLHEQN